jgi:hypothetical protein
MLTIIPNSVECAPGCLPRLSTSQASDLTFQSQPRCVRLQRRRALVIHIIGVFYAPCC